MASPNATFTELVSTTFRKHSGEFKDQFSNHNALYGRLTKKGRSEACDGGLSIVEELDYAENATYQRYSGYDPLNITPSDVLTAAEYAWKQSAIHVTASGRELRINSGRSQIINLAKSRLLNAMRTYKNKLSSDIYSDGTASNQIGGLQAIIPGTAGGTLGGINGTTYTWWRGTVQSAASPITGSAITVSETTFEKFMRQLYIDLTRGSDEPDLIVLANDYYELFEGSQVSIKRYTADVTKTQDNANAGLVSLKYKKADVFHDGGSGISATTGYMLNTDYLKIRYHPQANMTEVPEMRAINQDAVVIPIIWMGNITCSNRALQGILKA